MNEPLVSVVIPVYNGENVVDHCIKSVLSQTYKNIEVICVNDGSKDNSLSALKKLKAEDNRIKIIDQANCGAFRARRNGILNALGDYILFLDVDDVLPNRKSVDILVNYIKNDPTVDLIQFSNKEVYKFGITKTSRKAFTGKIGIKDFYCDYAYQLMSSNPKTAFTPTLWDKLYKADILKSAVLEADGVSLPVGEDLYLNLLYLDNPKVQSLLVTDDVFYSYYVGIGVMSTGNPWKAVLGYAELKELQLHLCEKWCLDDEAVYNCHMETVYYRFVVVKNDILNGVDEKVITENIRKTNECSHYREAKAYFALHRDRMFPELEILLDATPEDYLKYAKSKSLEAKRSLKSRLKSVFGLFMK